MRYGKLSASGSGEVVRARADERARFGRDLHDGVCQQLAGAAYALEVVRQKLAGRQAPETPDVVRVTELVERALSEARAMAHGMQPVLLGDAGLVPALVGMMGSVEAVYGATCSVVFDEVIGRIREETAGQLYGIAREAVGNAVRHGRARSVRIELAVMGTDKVRMTVADDGLGLKNAVEDGGGIGLRTMACRARAMGGTLEVRTGDKSGTIVTCAVPAVGG